MKLRNDFLSWARVEAARRGAFLYEVVEDLAARALGSKPWRP